MSIRKHVPAPYDDKNVEDYLRNTQEITEALEWMERNLDKLKLSEISIATLSRKIGLHRNTLSNRGQWIKDKLKTLKEIKRRSAKTEPTEEEQQEQEKALYSKLQRKLEAQREETARQFGRAEYFKSRLKDAEHALAQLTKQNLELQEENAMLLKKIAPNIIELRK